MSQSSKSSMPELIKIPTIFQSDMSEAPFEHCLMCDRYLLDASVPYFVEKAFKAHPEYKVKETVFEYAICQDCALKMQKQLSFTSMMQISLYFLRKVSFRKRRKAIRAYYQQHPEASLTPWLSECLVSKSARESLNEYQIYGHCQGEYLFFDEMPYMLSGQVMDEIAERLSKKTRDELDRFADDNFGLPPELKKALASGRPVLV